MSWQEISMNIVIGLATGLVSGYVSGALVTSKFNKKEKELNWKKELSEEKQDMVRYLELVQFDLNLIKNKLIDNENFDYSDFLKLLIDEPRTPNVTENKVTEASLKHKLGAVNLLKEIRTDIESKTITPESIKIHDSKFLRAKFDILSITPK